MHSPSSQPLAFFSPFLPSPTEDLAIARAQAETLSLPGLHGYDHPESFFHYDWVYFLPETYLSLMGLFLLMWAVWIATTQSYKYPALSGPYGLLGGFTLLLTATLYMNGVDGIDREIFNKGLCLDPLASYLSVLLLCATLATILLAGSYHTHFLDRLPPYEINALILYAGLSMILLVQANDLLMVYLCIEFQSMCLYVLAASKRQSVLSVEAGLKYFVLGALASAIFLFGASLLYGLTGFTKLDDIALFLQASESTTLDTPLLMGLLCLGVGLMFKVGAAPFHIWVPDVYEGAPTPVTAFFAVGPKMALFSLILRILSLSSASVYEAWGILLGGCAGLSFLVGAWGALAQTKLKRVFAYSSIGHVGWILLSLSCVGESGYTATLVYMSLYICMSLLVFGILLSLRSAGESRRILRLHELQGLGHTHPMMAFCLSVGVLSMAGIPPLAGFASKALVLMAAVEAHAYGIAFLGLLTSVVSTFYYLRLVSIMYFESQPTDVHEWETPDEYQAGLIGGMTLLILGFGLWPQAFLTGAKYVALSLVLR